MLVEVDEDEVLFALSDEDLLEELELRGKKATTYNLGLALSYLGGPLPPDIEDLVKPLAEIARRRCVTHKDLESWKKWATA